MDMGTRVSAMGVCSSQETVKMTESRMARPHTQVTLVAFLLLVLLAWGCEKEWL